MNRDIANLHVPQHQCPRIQIRIELRDNAHFRWTTRGAGRILELNRIRQVLIVRQKLLAAESQRTDNRRQSTAASDSIKELEEIRRRRINQRRIKIAIAKWNVNIEGFKHG